MKQNHLAGTGKSKVLPVWKCTRNVKHCGVNWEILSVNLHLSFERDCEKLGENKAKSVPTCLLSV